MYVLFNDGRNVMHSGMTLSDKQHHLKSLQCRQIPIFSRWHRLKHLGPQLYGLHCRSHKVETSVAFLPVPPELPRKRPGLIDIAKDKSRESPNSAMKFCNKWNGSVHRLATFDLLGARNIYRVHVVNVTPKKIRHWISNNSDIGIRE